MRLAISVQAAVAVAAAGLVFPAAASPAPSGEPTPAPRNPWLVDSSHPLGYGTWAQQDSTSIAGPLGPARSSLELRSARLEDR